ncbi:MAG: GGDEF domain-containing protein [Acidimicrobiia bacterium]|nr:GGDEF domain-containing protein [Acidimicrobiia bacterium]
MGAPGTSSQVAVDGIPGRGPTIDEVVAALTDLPTLAPIAVRVIELADDEDVSIEQLTNVIATDPGLATRLLRLANSAAYGSSRPITNLNRAAMLLGLRTLKMVTLGFSLVTGLSPDGIGSEAIWRQSLAGAVLARRLAAGRSDDAGDDAFVAGLLSNIGKLALAATAADYDDSGFADPWLSAREQIDLLGYTSDEVTARLLADWSLPEDLGEAIRTRSGLVAEQTPLGEVLQVATAAMEMLLTIDDDRQAHAYDVLASTAAAHLNLDINDLQRMIEEARPELDAMFGSFDLQAVSPVSVDEILRTAQAKLISMSLDVATQLSAERHRNEVLVEHNERLAAAASTDALTGLANRRTFETFFTDHLAGRLRSPRPTMLGLLIFDLDFFKAVNDNYGHRVGDEVLQEVGRRLQDGTRRGELSARLGGEEFATILPDVIEGELTGAAERMRRLISDHAIETGAGLISVTVSVGGACTAVMSARVDKMLFDAADSALYASKDRGRNRVTVASIE